MEKAKLQAARYRISELETELTAAWRGHVSQYQDLRSLSQVI